MSELLLEIISEEIPPHSHIDIRKQMQDSLTKKLQKNNLVYQDLAIYSSPTRIVILIKDLQECKARTEKKGPKTDIDEQLLNKFLEANNVKKKDLVVKKTEKGSFYFIRLPKITIEKQLQSILTDTILSVNFAKSMRWGNQHIRWIRPIRNICCLYNTQILELKIGNCIANNFLLRT